MVPGMNITIGQPISHRIDHMLSGTRANVAVKLFGPNLYELRTLAEQVKGRNGAGPGRGRPVGSSSRPTFRCSRFDSAATPWPATG